MEDVDSGVEDADSGQPDAAGDHDAAGEHDGSGDAEEPGTPSYELHVDEQVAFVGSSIRLEITAENSGDPLPDDGEISWSTGSGEDLIESSGDPAILEFTAERPGRTTLEISFRPAPGAEPTVVDTVELEFVRWKQIDANQDTTCGVLTNGALYCWGSNEDGVLGIDPDTEDHRSTPHLVDSTTSFDSVAVGTNHVCALDRDGAIYCWGNNEFGQVGNGDSGSSESTPTRVVAPDGANPLPSFKAIASGEEFSCALVGELSDPDNQADPDNQTDPDNQADPDNEGFIYCWGNNEDYRTTQKPTDPSETTGSPATTAPTPLNVDSDTQFKQISLGNKHGCAIEINDRSGVWCWGSNPSGQKEKPEHIPIPALEGTGEGEYTSSKISRIAAGAQHQCAQTQDDEIYCWGDNEHEQIMIEGKDMILKPDNLSEKQQFLRGTIFAGGNSNCVILNDDDSAACWGHNQTGQLGSATDEKSVRIPRTIEILKWESITLGPVHSCGITTDQSEPGGYCWGWSGHGQLGNDTEHLTGDQPTREPAEIEIEQMQIPPLGL